MPLHEDQATTADPKLLGRFIAAVRSVASAIVEEPILTLNHTGRMAFAKRAMLERGADNYGRVILELAIANNAKLIQDRENVGDPDVISIVSHYVGIFASEGW